jgi:HNH endonuclease
MPPGTTSATASASSAAASSRLRTRPLSRDRGGDARSAALAESMEAHQRAISVHLHAMLCDIAAFSATEAFRGDGALSMAAWLSERCKVSAGSARTLALTAEKVGELPALFGALSAGRLTLDVLAPLAAVATTETDAELAEAALHWSVRQAKELARAARGMDEREAAKTFTGRFVRFDDARCAIWAQLTKDAYAIVKSTLVARATRHDHPSANDPDYEPLEARLADALVEVCIERGRRDGGTRDGGARGVRGGGGGGFAGEGDGGGRGGDSDDPSSDSGRPLFGGAPAHIVVHADLSFLLGRDELMGLDGEGTASLEGLGPISAEIARRLSCDGTHTISLEAPDGTILDQFPWRRSPTTAQRIEIARRDGGCRFPGCGYDLITNVHHLRHWVNGGPTVLSNLITLCAAHHSRVHELGWKMSGDANELVTFTSPHGRESISSPSPVWRRSLPVRK